jgi:MFS family permease
VRNALVRERDGRLLVAAQLSDHLAVGLAGVALPWLVLDAGGGPALAGLVFAAGTLPYVLFGLLAGVTGDRRSRKRVMSTAHVLQAASAAVLPLAALAGEPPPLLVLAIAFAVGTGRVYADAASFGAVADMVGPAKFVEAQAALSTAWAAGSIAGPFLAGVLIASFGAVKAVAVESCVLGAAALLVWSIRRPLLAPRRDESERIGDAVREGLAVIRRVPLLRLLTAVQFVWYLLVIGGLSLLVPFLREELELGAREAGWILGVGAAMGLAGGVIVGTLQRRFGGVRVVSAGIVASGAGTVALSISPEFWTALLSSALTTLAVWMSVTTLIGERQRHAPPNLQGRVGITGRAIAFGSMTVGSLVVSALAGVVPLRVVFLGVGLATLAVSAWAVPALLRRENAAGGEELPPLGDELP